MNFDQMSITMADALFNALGVPVDFHHKTGVVSGIQAIIDKDVLPYPDTFESGMSERRTEISFLMADIPKHFRAEKVVNGSDVYTIANKVSDDGIVIKYGAKQDT